MEGSVHFNVFTVDFNEELVALYGGSLQRQTRFLHESIKAILRLYKVRDSQSDTVQPSIQLVLTNHGVQCVKNKSTFNTPSVDGVRVFVQTSSLFFFSYLTFQHLKNPPHHVVLVGHSMGGVVARALFTLPRFNTSLVKLIITQASPHLAPVLALDPHLLGQNSSDAQLIHSINKNIMRLCVCVDFYSAVRQKWVKEADKLRNITVLSIAGGYRDYQVRSGLTSLPCSSGDNNKLSLVVRVLHHYH